MSQTETQVQEGLRRINGAPAVSVVIPSYNTAQYIGETLDSLFRQTFTDYEAIIVNDGSPDTDELERTLEPYRERIIYIKQGNRGVSGARNTAIMRARGKYVAFLDSDDMWEPEYLAEQVTALERAPTVDVHYTNALIFGDHLPAKRIFMEECPSHGEVTFERLITQQCNVLTSATVGRREIIIRAGMFDEGLGSAEDFDLWLRVVKQGGRIAYSPRVLVHYRRREGGFTTDPVWMFEHVVRVMEKAARSLSLTPAERDTLERRRDLFYAMARLHEAKRALLHDDADAAIERLTEANSFLRRPKIALALLLLRVAPRLVIRAYNMHGRLFLKAHT